MRTPAILLILVALIVGGGFLFISSPKKSAPAKKAPPKEQTEKETASPEEKSKEKSKEQTSVSAEKDEPRKSGVTSPGPNKPSEKPLSWTPTRVKMSYESVRDKFLARHHNTKFKILGAFKTISTITGDTLKQYAQMFPDQAAQKFLQEHTELGFDLPEDVTLFVKSVKNADERVLVTVGAEKNGVIYPGEKTMVFRTKDGKLEGLTDYINSFHAHIKDDGCNLVDEKVAKSIVMKYVGTENVIFTKITKAINLSNKVDGGQVWDVEFKQTMPTGGEMTMYAQVSPCRPEFVAYPTTQKAPPNLQGDVKMYVPPEKKNPFPNGYMPGQESSIKETKKGAH